MCHPANDAAREAVVASVLHFVGLAADALPAVLGTFGVHSQAGDKMQESSAVTMKTIPDEDARKAVGAWAAPLTGQGFVLSVLAKNCDCQTDPRPSLHGGTLCDSICVALSCSGGEFSPDGLHDYSFTSVMPMAGKYTTNFSQYTSNVCVCVCMFANFFFPGEVSFRYLALTGNGPRPHTLW